MSASNKKIGVLLINLGTPDSTSVGDVRRYLREFLMDRRVIDVPFIQRFPLVCGIIAPFRAPESAKIYREVWQERGSPLKFYGEDLVQKLQTALGDNYHVGFAMRYKNPNLRDVVKNFENKGFSKIIAIPMYPQYASSSTGSTIEYLMEHVRRWEVLPSMEIVGQFFNNPDFIQCIVENAKPMMEKETYDHFVFSYHGIPERHIKKSSCDGYCQITDKCCGTWHDKNRYCYRAQCFATTRLLTEALNIPQDKHTVCFQSRLGKDPWIQPYAEDTLINLAKSGKKKVLAFSPAFVTDCLETTIEVGEEYKELFLENGGEQWDLVQSLNANDSWVDCLKNMVEKSSH